MTSDLSLPEVLASLAQLLEAHPAGLGLAVLGLLATALFLLRLALGVASFLYTYLLRPGRNLRQYGSWAVVTGATDGIGKAYAAELAAKGLNIVLVSRTESKLRACEAELRAAHSVDTRCCAIDLSRAADADFQRVASCLEGLDIGLLINNAGTGSDPAYLDEMPDRQAQDIITVNMLSLTLMAKLVLPGMKQRRRGIIANVGSGAANALHCCVPLSSVYAGTKAYVEAFSQFLDAEYKEFGVRVQNQWPLFVATKMSAAVNPGQSFPSARGWARAAVRQVGYDTSSTPHWYHGLQAIGTHLLPKFVVIAVVEFIMKRARLRLRKQQCVTKRALLLV